MRTKYFQGRVRRAQFRNLPKGATYYLSAGGTGPFVKIGPRAILATNTFPTSNAGTAIADTSVLTKRVGKSVLTEAILR